MNRYILSLSLCFCLPALAQTPVMDCAPSSRMEIHNYPGAQNIPPNNNLTQYSGKAVAASGQQLIVEGRLRDKNCVPVAGAMIELWQADPFGNWRLATREDLVNPNPVFSGAGRTNTDNNGGFSFITLFPGAGKNHMPHLHLRIRAPGMDDFYTMLYFEGDVRNESDGAYKKLSAEARHKAELTMSPIAQDPNAGFVASAIIILPGAAPYRTY